MNNLPQYIILNGDFFLENTPVLPVSNRAFCYGDSIFETMHAAGSEIQFAQAHFNRLFQGMEVLHLNENGLITRDRLANDIYRLIQRNKLFGGVRVRLQVFRNAAGLFTPSHNNVAWVITTTPLPEAQYTLNSKGLTIGIYYDLKKPVNLLAPFKTGCAINYILAGIYKKEQQWDDCLIVNDKNQIIEGFHSNLFLVKANGLYTPPLQQGCTNGVMRQKIIEIAPTVGLKVSEQIVVTESLLANADEIFLTNAVEGIQWVQAFNNRRYYNKTAKELCLMLNKLAFEK